MQQLTDKDGPLCLNCLCKQYGLCRMPAHLLGVWNSGACKAEHECLHTQLPIKTLGFRSMVSPGQNTAHKNKDLLHSMGNSIQYSSITYLGKKYENEWIICT